MIAPQTHVAQTAHISVSLLMLGCLSLVIAASPLSFLDRSGRPESNVARPHPETPKPTPPTENFTIEPSQVVRSTTHTLVITSEDCDHKTFEADDTVISQDDIKGLKDKGLEIKSPKRTSECKFTAELSATDTATFGPVSITIH